MPACGRIQQQQKSSELTVVSGVRIRRMLPSIRATLPKQGKGRCKNKNPNREQYKLRLLTPRVKKI